MLYDKIDKEHIYVFVILLTVALVILTIGYVGLILF